MLTSLTTAEGTFHNIAGLTCAPVSGGTAFGATNEGKPSSRTNALSGLRFTQGAVNQGHVDWLLDTPVKESDKDVRFFFGETCLSTAITPDTVTIVPLSGGQPVLGQSLVIVSSDYGTPSPVWENTYFRSFVGVLVTFSLADFRTLPSLNPNAVVDGFRVNCNLKADPNVFGMYRIPQKGTFIMVL